MRTGPRYILLAALMALVCLAGRAPAQTASPTLDNPLHIPDARQILPVATDRQGMSTSLQILVLLTVLSLAPAIFILTTSFTRIVVVLALLRQALGAQQMPPGQVLTGLALMMTAMVMMPTWRNINNTALQPYLNGKITQADALEQTGKALRGFMIRQIEKMGNEEDVYMFWEYQRGKPIPAGQNVSWNQVPTLALAPAFVLSELKTAFIIGFRIYVPFLVIDMVISTVLVSMGMMMLPPVMISMPFKLLLFVLSDGWHLVAGTMLGSFAG